MSDRRAGNPDSTQENRTARAIVDLAFKIHTALGPGLLESVYETVLAYELEKGGHQVERQVAFPVRYDGLVLDGGFRVDLMVDGVVLVEFKSIEAVLPVHKKQLTTYLRMADKRLGLLVNFGVERMKNGITRIVNGLPE